MSHVVETGSDFGDVFFVCLLTFPTMFRGCHYIKVIVFRLTIGHVVASFSELVLQPNFSVVHYQNPWCLSRFS